MSTHLVSPNGNAICQISRRRGSGPLCRRCANHRGISEGARCPLCDADFTTVAIVSEGPEVLGEPYICEGCAAPRTTRCTANRFGRRCNNSARDFSARGLEVICWPCYWHRPIPSPYACAGGCGTERVAHEGPGPDNPFSYCTACRSAFEVCRDEGVGHVRELSGMRATAEENAAARALSAQKDALLGLSVRVTAAIVRGLGPSDLREARESACAFLTALDVHERSTESEQVDTVPDGMIAAYARRAIEACYPERAEAIIKRLRVQGTYVPT